MDLLRSKLSVPRAGRGLVSRPRVLDLFQLTPTTRLCVLSAPPGFGKTSAVIDWLQTSGRRAAWLSLDEADNDPGRFVPYLVAAIGGVSGPADSLARLEATDPPDVVVAGLLALLDEPDAPHVIVLDDLHLIQDASVLAIVEALVTHLPEDRLVVIITREDPPLRLSRLRAAGELVELRADQLRFTEKEADSFFRERMTLSLSTDAVYALTRSTEGWPAVLQLAALSLVGRPDASARATQIAADHRLIIDYIAEEVLSRLDDDSVDFLLRTAHLERLTGDLCDAVTGRTDGAATLERLERANLLLVPLDEQRRWYRYHRLFAELLRHRGQALAPHVHLAAARWCWDAKLLAEALEHAVLVGDLATTEALIWRVGSRMLHVGEVPAVRSSLARMPLDVARSSVSVCLLQGWACVLAEPALDPEDWLRCAAAALDLVPPGQELLAPLLPGMSSMIRSLAADHAGRSQEAVELAQAALKDGPPETSEPLHAVIFQGDGLIVLGHAYWGAGDLNRAVGAYRDALPLLRQGGNWLAVAEVTANLAHIELGRGRAADALAVCDEFGERGTPADARVLLVRAEALRDLGRPEAADVVAAALERAREAGDLTTITRARALALGRTTGGFSLPTGQSVSARELEVLRLIAAGRSNAQIAAELFVSVGTVKTHAHSIATKLDTASRMETTARARELGLLE